MRLTAVIGPTASGKTALAVALAQRDGAEVVNADALQCYRRMDIGTAKPTEAERGGVRHHCLDLWEPDVEAGVQQWREAAETAIADVHGRGRDVVLVGGTGLYVRALLEGWQLPGTDPAVRARLEAELAAEGPAALHARLAQVDPAAAAEILPGNGRRLVRALEVVELTGEPFQARLPEPGPLRWQARLVGLAPEVAANDAAIEVRTRRMWEQGLVEEVRAIRDSVGFGRTAAAALGYAQVLRQLAGELTEAAALAETAQATRRYTRRQRSWWRGDPRVTWVSDPLGWLSRGD